MLTRKFNGFTESTQYNNLLRLIQSIDVACGPIETEHKIKSWIHDIKKSIVSTHMLKEFLEYGIESAIYENEDNFGRKFAIFMTSYCFSNFTVGDDIKTRSHFLSLLQKNFNLSEEYRKLNPNYLYNFISLLGEYYHRFKLIYKNDTNKPCPSSDLGLALTGMLIDEIESIGTTRKFLRFKFAKLLLEQLTLNHNLLREYQPSEINLLLYHIRRIIIEIPLLKSCTKAVLLMTLDLYYRDLKTLEKSSEEMYANYLSELETFDDAVEEKNYEYDISNLLKLVTKTSIETQTDNEDLTTEISEISWVTCSNDATYNESIHHLSTKKDKEYYAANNYSEDYNKEIKCINYENSDEVKTTIFTDEDKKWSELVREENSKFLTNEISNNGDSYNIEDSLKNVTNEESSSNNMITSKMTSKRTNQSNDDDRRSIRSEDGSLRLYSVQERFKNKRNPSLSPSLSSEHKNWKAYGRNYGNNENNNKNIFNRNNKNENYFTNHSNTNSRSQYSLPPRFNKNLNHQNQQQIFTTRSYHQVQDKNIFMNRDRDHTGNYFYIKRGIQHCQQQDDNSSNKLNSLSSQSGYNNCNRRPNSLDRSYMNKSTNDISSNISSDNFNNMRNNRRMCYSKHKNRRSSIKNEVEEIPITTMESTTSNRFGRNKYNFNHSNELNNWRNDEQVPEDQCKIYGNE